MEVSGGVGSRRMSREGSPERGKAAVRRARPAPVVSCRKVQIVYYLSRDGQLEHPHFMELSQLPNQLLRLKDVIERLTVLRGKGMPSLFSWSCKRSYKNGYVWNDLSENDVIYPADGGAEYVLKGSEIVHGCSERYQHLPVSLRRPRLLPAPHHSRNRVEVEEEEEEIEEEEEEEEEIEEEEVVRKSGKLIASDTVNAVYRCSRGVSTEDVVPNGKHTELALDDASPPSSSSSDKAANGSGVSQRFEDGDLVGEPGLSRNSVLLQLISCGSVAVKGSGGRKSGSLHKGVLSRFATRAAAAEGEAEEDMRFAKEEKEYFSGSIIECITGSSRSTAEPTLKKSNSYNEERGSKLGIGEERLEVGEDKTGGIGKCIPGRKRSSTSKQQQPQQPTKCPP